MGVVWQELKGARKMGGGEGGVGVRAKGWGMVGGWEQGYVSTLPVTKQALP
jgi:hypothetical protein